ncbi:response regulator [Lysinibacillus sp. CNPSo 3705]|uniref:response regulator n=1 Tax=Lysinibacillus sp. CNPSo 3705 TaxID=3028148 RepID=UPI001042B421|nr:response regulator [Lysinibacillus sp. CNPSo 3705]MDD1501578.1 response regulator [Lysinibacillus sp. CNPSo 3705]
MTISKSVWIIEDDFRVAKIHADYVHNINGFIVTENLRTGKETIEKLKTTSILPEIVLTDLYIPDVEGSSLVSHIRHLYPSIKIIVISAATEISLIKDIVDLGISDYLIKPFEELRLQRAFQKYLQEHHLFQNSKNVTQKDLDSLFYRESSNKIIVEETFVKGIDFHTLQIVKSIFEDLKTQELTASQLSELIGSSRSTARRYLEYLVGEQFLQTKLIYGTVGRPERKYVYHETYEQN